jgi:hypothetical protein
MVNSAEVGDGTKWKEVRRLDESLAVIHDWWRGREPSDAEKYLYRLGA